MSPAEMLLIAGAGGAGAAARLVLDGLIRSRAGSGFPWGTTAINVSGSLLLGLVTALAALHGLAEPWTSAIGTGLLGGYTTFSTASFETVRLVQDRRHTLALANGLGMLVLSVAAASLGWLLGSL